jgi:nicotinamide riboside kinase
MSKIKYAYCGAHGTGKSAAAHFMAAKLKKEDPTKTVKVLEESVRETTKLVGINNVNFQKLAISESLYNQVFYSSMYDIVICDRIPLDYIVYAVHYGVVLPKAYYDIAFNNALEFDKIYFVRPDDTPIADDGFRFTDLEERAKIDLRFKDYLTLAEIPFEELKTQDVFR